MSFCERKRRVLRWLLVLTIALFFMLLFLTFMTVVFCCSTIFLISIAIFSNIGRRINKYTRVSLLLLVVFFLSTFSTGRFFFFLNKLLRE